MKKINYILIAFITILISIPGWYLYIDESYVCNAQVDSKTAYLGSHSPDEILTYKINFGFGWNGFTNKIKLSSIDQLGTVNYHLNHHYASLRDGGKHSSHISSNEMGVHFASDRDAFLHRSGDRFSYERSSISFDKHSKYIVILKERTSKYSKLESEENVKISGQCSRQWFN